MKYAPNTAPLRTSLSSTTHLSDLSLWDKSRPVPGSCPQSIPRQPGDSLRRTPAAEKDGKKVSMAQIRDWQRMKDMSARLLQERTGLDVATWNQRIQAQDLKEEQALRSWLTEQGVTGSPKICWSWSVSAILISCGRLPMN